jgi:multidrug efflux system membrane fusion protein
MSRHWFISSVAVAVLAILSSGCKKGAPPEAEKVPPAPVKWEGSRQIFLEEWTELVGTSLPLPEHAARVTSPVEGRVLSVLGGAAGKPVAEGQPVDAGTVLVRLEDLPVRLQRDKAVAARKVAQADKEVADLGVKQATIEVKRLLDLKQKQKPDERDLVPQVQMDLALLAEETAKAHVRAAAVKLEAADEEVAALDRQLQFYMLTAPRKGRLGRLQVVVGQTLAIGAAVADIVDIDDEIDVLCFVPAAEVRKLKVGQPARIGGVEKGPDAEAGADPEGSLVFIADQAEPETGNFAVKVRFPNRDLKLRANSVVRVRVLTKPGKACWALPEGAVMEDQDPPVVIVVEDIEPKMNADGKEEQVGKARRLRAVLGMRSRLLHQVEIVRLDDPDKKWQGSLDSAQFVVEKNQGLQTGDAVRLEEEEAEETPPMPGEKK